MMTPGCDNVVMVVDDDRDVREAIVEVLEDNAYRPVQAANGEEALNRLRTAPIKPCLILLDIMMPHMDGWQFRAAQCEDPVLGAIPVIVLSAHASIHESASDMKVAATLRKPIQLKNLLTLLERFCPKPRPAA